jgi:FkbM family methyltransferase
MMLKNLLRKLRRSPFDFPVSGGGTIGDIVCAPLDQAGLEFAAIDLGARNGMYHLPTSYSLRSKLIGFEPNPQEYEKLTSGTTDMSKRGQAAPPFKSTEYHPFAVWRAKERRQFYITAVAGACTLMGESVPAVTGQMFLDSSMSPDRSKTRRATSYADITRVVRTVPVDCIALDDVIADGTTIDFLKMDVEGAELACLQGARRLLDSHRVLFVYSEFVTLPYYAAHDLLGAQHVFLSERGYRLIDLDLRHPTYRRGPHDLPKSADRRMIYAGDAIFVLDPDRVALDAPTKQRLAAILFVFGFSSYALSLLDEAGLTSKADIERIEASVRRTMTTRRLMLMWKQLPAGVMKAFS